MMKFNDIDFMFNLNIGEHILICFPIEAL